MFTAHVVIYFEMKYFIKKEKYNQLFKIHAYYLFEQHSTM